MLKCVFPEIEMFLLWDWYLLFFGARNIIFRMFWFDFAKTCLQLFNVKKPLEAQKFRTDKYLMFCLNWIKSGINQILFCCTVKPAYTSTSIRRPMLSPPNLIPMQSLLYKTTTCLTLPATTVFVPQMKKYLSKITTAKLYLAKKWEAVRKK